MHRYLAVFVSLLFSYVFTHFSLLIEGMTAEIIEKLQEKATVLTQERKKRGKTVPEVCVRYLLYCPVLRIRDAL
jgi:hypothetical protein